MQQGRSGFDLVLRFTRTDFARYSGKTRAMVGAFRAAPYFLLLMIQRLGWSTIFNFPAYARYHGV